MKRLVLFILVVSFFACERNKNIKLTVNNEDLLFEVRGYKCSDDSPLICLSLQPRFGIKESSVTIDIFNVNPSYSSQPITNINPNYSSQPISNNNTLDSVYVYYLHGLPEFGNQEKRVNFDLDIEQSHDFELLEFDKNKGRCKIKIYTYLCSPRKDDCNFFNAEYTDIVEGEFDFRIY